jgi:hypothetical protein
MKLNTDRIVSLSAMVAGLGSLFIIVYQTHLTRQAQHASMLPYLMFAVSANDGGVHIALSNAGVGPALVEDIRVRYRGQAFEGDAHDFYLAQGLATTEDLSVNSVMSGRLIPAGAWLEMVGVEDAVGTERGQAFLGEVLRLFEVAEVPDSWYAAFGDAPSDQAVIEIVYTSVYGDRWRVRSDQIVPEQL